MAGVVRVVDGDTIEARIGGRDEDVRLIGIDTPETVKPDTPVQCFGERASHFTKRRLTGRRVRLAFGSSGATSTGGLWYAISDACSTRSWRGGDSRGR